MSKVEKRTKTTKYSELEKDEIDDDTINEVLDKTKDKKKERHAFDGITDEQELTE